MWPSDGGDFQREHHGGRAVASDESDSKLTLHTTTMDRYSRPMGGPPDAKTIVVGSSDGQSLSLSLSLAL